MGATGLYLYQVKSKYMICKMIPKSETQFALSTHLQDILEVQRHRMYGSGESKQTKVSIWLSITFLDLSSFSADSFFLSLSDPCKGKIQVQFTVTMMMAGSTR